jgi:hypothetical protein
MTPEDNVKFLSTALELRQTCRKMIVRLQEGANGDESKLQTIAMIETLFNVQSDLIAALIELQLETNDVIDQAIERLTPK